MSKKCALLAGIVFTIAVAGCYVQLPEKMEKPNYSAGPVSSHDFPILVKDAVPREKGKIHVFGNASWHGFYDPTRSLHFTDPYFSGVAALTDTEILLLLWNEDLRRYEIVEQVPYTEIRFLPEGEWGSTGPLTILTEQTTIAVGGQSYMSRKWTYLGFNLPSGWRIDREKNKQAHLLFEEKVERFVRDDSANVIEDNH